MCYNFAIISHLLILCSSFVRFTLILHFIFFFLLRFYLFLFFSSWFFPSHSTSPELTFSFNALVLTFSHPFPQYSNQFLSSIFLFFFMVLKRIYVLHFWSFSFSPPSSSSSRFCFCFYFFFLLCFFQFVRFISYFWFPIFLITGYQKAGIVLINFSTN